MFTSTVLLWTLTALQATAVTDIDATVWTTRTVTTCPLPTVPVSCELELPTASGAFWAEWNNTSTPTSDVLTFASSPQTGLASQYSTSISTSIPSGSVSGNGTAYTGTSTTSIIGLNSSVPNTDSLASTTATLSTGTVTGTAAGTAATTTTTSIASPSSNDTITPDTPPTAKSGEGAFYVSLTPAGGTKQKRSTYYIGFVGTDAVAVTDTSLAWPLDLDSSTTVLGFSGKSGFMGTDSATAAGPIRRTSDDQSYEPSNYQGWTISLEGTLTFGTAQFCTMSNTTIFAYWDGVLPDGCNSVAVTPYSVPPPTADTTDSVDGPFRIQIENLGSTYFAGFCGAYQEEVRACNTPTLYFEWTMSGGEVYTTNGTQGWLSAANPDQGNLVTYTSLQEGEVYNRWIVDANNYLQMPAVGNSPAASFSGSADGQIDYNFNGASGGIQLKVVLANATASSTTATTTGTAAAAASTTGTTDSTNTALNTMLVTTPSVTPTATTPTHPAKGTAAQDFTMTQDVQTVTASGATAYPEPTRSATCNPGADTATCGTQVQGTGIYEDTYAVYCGEFWTGYPIYDTPPDATTGSAGFTADSFDQCLQWCDDSSDCVAMSFSSNSDCNDSNCRLYQVLHVRYTDTALNDYSSWDSAAIVNPGPLPSSSVPKAPVMATTDNATAQSAAPTASMTGTSAPSGDSSSPSSPSSTSSMSNPSEPTAPTSPLSPAAETGVPTTPVAAYDTAVGTSTGAVAAVTTSMTSNEDVSATGSTTSTQNQAATTPTVACTTPAAGATFSILASGSKQFPTNAAAVVVPSGSPSYPFDYVTFESSATSPTLFTLSTDGSGTLTDLTDGNTAVAPYTNSNGACSFLMAPQSTINDLGYSAIQCSFECAAAFGQPSLNCFVGGYTTVWTQTEFPYLAIADYQAADFDAITLQVAVVGE